MPEKQPREGDMVLAEKNLPPQGAAVLGGITGIVQRLKSENEQERIDAVIQAVNYGDAGLDLIIKALKDKSARVKRKAYLLLCERQEEKVKQALQNFNPAQLLSKFGFIMEDVDKTTQLIILITPDGKRLVSGNKEIKIWDLTTQECLFTLGEHLEKITALDITPDGKKLVSRSRDGIIKTWDLTTKKCLYTLNQRNSNFETRGDYLITPDGKKFVTGSRDGIIKIWDLTTKKCLYTLNQRNSTFEIRGNSTFETRGNNLYVTTRSDTNLTFQQIWDLNTFQLVGMLWTFPC